MKKILILGYMASGKSTFSNFLSKKTGLKMLDLDEEIEKIEGCSIPELFETKGEIYFRKLENSVLKKLLHNDESFILALGGGTPCYANNHLLLQNEHVLSIYLKVSVSVLVERLIKEKQKRPLISNIEDSLLSDFVGNHLFERNYFYNFSKIKVDASKKTLEDIYLEILPYLN